MLLALRDTVLPPVLLAIHLGVLRCRWSPIHAREGVGQRAAVAPVAVREARCRSVGRKSSALVAQALPTVVQTAAAVQAVG